MGENKERILRGRKERTQKTRKHMIFTGTQLGNLARVAGQGQQSTKDRTRLQYVSFRAILASTALPQSGAKRAAISTISILDFAGCYRCCTVRDGISLVDNSMHHGLFLVTWVGLPCVFASLPLLQRFRLFLDLRCHLHVFSAVVT